MAFTYFFRDMHTLQLIATNVIPYLYGRSKIKIWDAGCAMGQEAYSMAIVFAENLGHFAFKNLHIDATDIDGSDQFEEIIVNGVYHESELKRIPRELFKNYFKPVKNTGYFKVVDTVRKSINFQKHDLLSLRSIGTGYSLIICKNVLLHFQPGQRIEVIRMFHNSLDAGGFFATEQTQKLPEETEHLFERVSSDGQLFRKVS